MKIKNSVYKVIISVATMFLVFTGCSDPVINSEWRSDEITIDGNKNDWQGSLKYFEDEKVAIGISNDNDFVYFCLATFDNAKIMKILRTGFTVWLDPQNSDGETLGIQYPIKREKTGMMNKSQQGNRDGENTNKNFNQMIQKFKVEQNEILIVNRDKFPLNAYPLDNETGLEAKINYEMHQMVYELKIPLANNNSGNVYTDALPNELLKVGFESGEFDRPDRRERNSIGNSGTQAGNMPGGGTLNGGRGGKRGGGRSNMGSMGEIINPIDFWMEVKLATKE